MVCEADRKDIGSIENQGEDPEQNKDGTDLTGRDRMVSNVLFGWGGHLIFIIAGFIMPRMIDRRLGQEMLGIWDFAWSLVVYLGLLNMGVGAGVSRYVAKFRPAGDICGVNRIVSSSCCILGVGGILALLLTATASLVLPRLFGTRLQGNVREAQLVVFLLGSSLAVEISLNAFTAVLGGCHQWGLQNCINSGWHMMTVAGMIAILLLGGSLRGLALVNAAGSVLAAITRAALAHRVCQGLRVRASLIAWQEIRELLVFGGKSMTLGITNLLLSTTVNILILAYLGPAMLALYCRPQSLIGHLNTLVSKIAYVLTPVASSLQSTDNSEAIRALIIKSVRYSIYIALPAILVLVQYGGPVLQLWMGPRYANGLIPTILAAGYLAAIVQLPLLSVCAGLNVLGRPVIAQLLAAVLAVGLVDLALGPLGAGLAGAAIAVTAPLAVLNAIYLPAYICRRIALPLPTYFRETMSGPLVCVLPFGICLLVARIVFHAEPLTGLVWGGATGGVILAIVYWRYVIPDRIKISLLRRLTIRDSVLGD